MTSSVVVLKRNSKTLPKAKLSPKKTSWSLFGGLLPVWSTMDFWILVKPVHLRSTLNKSMRCTVNCSACSWHWRTERAQFCTPPPGCMLRSQHFRIWTNLATKLYAPDLTPTNYHFFKHLDDFLQGRHFHNQQEAENAFQEFIESQSVDFYPIGINKPIYCWQKHVDCNGSYFD